MLAHLKRKYKNARLKQEQKTTKRPEYQVPGPRRGRGNNTKRTNTENTKAPGSNTKRTKIENASIPGSNRNKKKQKGENTRLLVQDVLVIEDCIGRPHHLGSYLSSLRKKALVRRSSDNLFSKRYKPLWSHSTLMG